MATEEFNLAVYEFYSDLQVNGLLQHHERKIFVGQLMIAVGKSQEEVDQIIENENFSVWKPSKKFMNLHSKATWNDFKDAIE
jgi:hypothetical protein